MNATTADERFRRTDFSPEACAARNVPHNPNPLCRDFQAQPEPAAFWCATCHWNRPMHDNEHQRTAIANELAYLGLATPAA
jgi:hypothetical protein